MMLHIKMLSTEAYENHWHVYDLMKSRDFFFFFLKRELSSCVPGWLKHKEALDYSDAIFNQEKQH